jgi:A/G-specific adenine glycosylase
VQDGKVLLSRRPSSALLGGLWEFPNVPVDGEPSQQLAPALEMAYGLRVKPGSPLATIRHAYTHFKVVVHALCCELKSGNAELSWVPITSLGHYPMGKVDRQISRRATSNIQVDEAT